MNINKKLKNLITLSCNVKIYVPSTVNINENTNNELITIETLEFLAKRFGGSTSYKATGYWLSPQHGLVGEKIMICESFCDSQKLEKFIGEIIDFCQDMKELLKQESVAIEINNELHLI
jgi:hypothetical protein